MSTRVLTCIVVLAVTAILGQAAAAAPSFFGYTGLIVTPTADALNEGEYTIGAFTFNLEEGADSNVYAASMGLAEALELGFARFKPEGEKGETFVNAKYRFHPETEDHPAIAAGVFDFTDEIDTTTYVVLSKSMRWQSETKYGEITAPRVHVGVAGGQIDGVFGGVSAALGDRFLLMVEYDSADINFGARLAVSNEVRVHGALLDSDDVGIGISFNKMF